MIRILLCLVVLAFPAAATAQEPSFVDREHLKLAMQYWQGWPPCGYPSLGFIAEADAQTSTTGRIAAIAELGGPENLCRISYTNEFYERTTRRRNYISRCAVMIHELGHLHGREHSTDPNSIMAPTVIVEPRICVRNEMRRWNGCWRYLTAAKRTACRKRWLTTP